MTLGAGFMVEYRAAVQRAREGVKALPEGPAQEPPEWVYVRMSSPVGA